MKTTTQFAGAIAFFCTIQWTSAHAGHPLITEDTGTQGTGNYQLELTHDLSRDNEAGTKTLSQSLNAVLSYGLTDKFDIVVALPYEHSVERSGGTKTTVHGFADMEIAAKWRFHDEGPLSLALRPGLGLPTGNEDKGLSSEHIIPSLFGVMTYAIEPWAFHLHLGYTRNFHDGSGQRDHIYHASVAAEYHFGDSARLVADASTETNPDRTGPSHASSIVLGLIYSFTPDLDIDLGYRKGLSDAAGDHAWLAGLTIRF